MKKWLILVLSLGFAVSVSAAELLADMHADMAGCEACHENGEPSSDFAHENEQCVACHGSLSELEGAQHNAHDGMLVCSDCHNPHELEVGQHPTCDSCHDDGRTP
ncbi:cytochrome c3 family protein [Ferrimonas gelatinilytica]|uniref:Tetrahaem cytochrome domain-containing protein n=1 Tax=Ferrimonas gelatinilytica TaxID=1255257 RepID=A0ABP9S181_9GAMM